MIVERTVRYRMGTARLSGERPAVVKTKAHISAKCNHGALVVRLPEWTCASSRSRSAVESSTLLALEEAE